MARPIALAVFVRVLLGVVLLTGVSYHSFSGGPAIAAEQSDGKPTVKVWVNTASGVYHCPGTRYYGATKRGAYMTQGAAQKAGHRPAYGRVCE